MKKIKLKKTNYRKMYLFPSEIYHFLIQRLSEVERQELENLNIENSEVEEPMKDPLSEDNKDPIQPPEKIHATPNKESITPSEATPLNSAAADAISTVRKMKEKKFSCGICVNKKFTTKASLKRHNKTFHLEEQQVLKENVSSEAVHEPEKGASSKKRRFDNIHQSISVSDEESSENIPTHVKSSSVKRKRDIEPSDYDQRKRLHLDEPQRGIKRKAAKGLDKEEFKKFRWEPFP